jgi:N-acetylglucosamine-6-phosphate deacetylase
MKQAYTNGRLFDGDAIHDDRTLVVDDGRIADLAPAAPAGVEIIDLQGGLLAPGFIDVQVNGGGGVLFNDDPSPATIRRMQTAHRRFGTTGMLPTLISDSFTVMQAAADAVQAIRTEPGSGILGIHFEGPYLAQARKGAHGADKIRPMDDAALALFTADGLGQTVVTLAPEVVGSDAIARLTAAGVRVSAGHSAATYDDIRQGLAAGLTGFTHLFNAMTPLTSRAPGVVGAALEDPDSWCGIIVDGHHVHPASARVALAAKPAGRMMLVTDAMSAVGTDATSFQLAGETVTVSDGRCTTADGVLAGSNLDMATAVRNAIELLGLPLQEALRMASLYPAGFLGLDQTRGRLAPGYVADLVLLDDAINVQQTWIAAR